MAIQTRNSALAIKKEVTEGTPVPPAASGDYLALQDDFSMSPEIESLENAELKASIGASKPILGLENPTASMSAYLRHSGVEGQAPNYGDLLEAAFGSVEVEATEYDTVGGSTAAVVEVDSGEGAQYKKGQPLLVKDGANGYSIRPVESIAGDSLTLGFELGSAPASGVNLGKAVLYEPANEGHPSLTLWYYLGNGGAVEMMSGSRVTDISMTFEAGQLINATYSMEGIEFYFNPMEVTSSDVYLDFTDDNATYAAQVSEGFYKDPHELAEALQSAMNSVQSLEAYQVSYNDADGKFSVATTTSTLLSLLWNTGANAANTIGDLLGFDTASDDTGGTSYAADNAQSYGSPQSPAFDAADPLAAKSNEVLIGDADDIACFEASSVSVSLGTPKTDILSVCSESGKSGSIINERTVTVEVTALLEQYDADKWRRFRDNVETRFMYAFGNKAGGNWVAGQAGMVYMPSATISSWAIEDADGLATLNMTLTGFVNNSGEGEIFLGFV